MSTATADSAQSLERLTQEVFEVVKQLSLAAPRGRRRPGDLKEGEFLALAMLEEHETLTVGEIQRQLGVLPAQMSRIVRSLESREFPLIQCRINSHDKRKVDVCLTSHGQRVLAEYRQHRIGRILEVLRALDDEERDHLAAVIERVREVLRAARER
jgi:DNA-binding MarR family transcriptional regulator